jgi:hypothetical protein
MATSAEPTLLSGTVLRYYTDKTGYVTAADIQTADGVKMVHFPANRASYLYDNAPVGGAINVWVAPSASDANYWNVVGYGADRPTVWWNTVAVSDVDWLQAEPYINAGAQETFVSGDLKGVVTGNNSEILALVIKNDNGWSLVRVPPQMRQIAPGHNGTERITPLMRNATVEVVGVPEAPRVGGLSNLNSTIAADTIRINGDTVGAIGLPAIKLRNSDSLFGFDIGGSINNDMSQEEVRAFNRGYHRYRPITTTVTTTTESTTMPSSNTTMDNSMASNTTTTTTTTSQTATGQVMIVAADGTQLPVVEKDHKLWVKSADGTLTRLKKERGKYVVPSSMTGARMMMVMSDGRQMNMNTVNGRLVVVLADGTTAPVTLHTP